MEKIGSISIISIRKKPKHKTKETRFGHARLALPKKILKKEFNSSWRKIQIYQ
jgi:hypothetical protein